MRKRSMQTISDVQKVWHRVMSIRYRAGNQAVRIPSSNEFAEEFGISRSTVRIALEQLTREGVLVTRKGSGTFINPKKALLTNEHSTLVGLMFFDCNLFFYTDVVMMELESLFGELAKTDWNIRNVNAAMLTEDDVRMTIQHNYLDALLTFGAPKFVVKTADCLLPLINMIFHIDGITNVLTDYSNSVEKLFRICGKDQGIELWSMASENDPLRQCIESYPGIRHLETDLTNSTPVTAEMIRENFSRECPDWILLRPEMLDMFRGVICELYGEEKARKILWIYHLKPDTEHDWPGFFPKSDRRGEVREAIRLLKQKMNGKAETEDVYVKSMLIRCPDGTLC